MQPNEDLDRLPSAWLRRRMSVPSSLEGKEDGCASPMYGLRLYYNSSTGADSPVRYSATRK